MASPRSGGPCMGYMRACFKELYLWSYFAKQFIKLALALPIKLFMKLKPKTNSFTSEVVFCIALKLLTCDTRSFMDYY